MEKIDWKRKLTSRKFWAAVVGAATPVMTFAQVPDNTVAQVVSIIMGAGTLIAYIIGEGITDAAGVKSKDEKEQ